MILLHICGEAEYQLYNEKCHFASLLLFTALKCRGDPHLITVYRAHLERGFKTIKLMFPSECVLFSAQRGS